IAELLSAVSVIGILEQLDGTGFVMGLIDADFTITPDQFTLHSSSAVGPSLGLSLDGWVDLQNNTVNFQGVLSPFYLVNAIGSIFTRKGEGLFGFNFTLKGPTQDISVGVNPLSIFTPGLFREIFRRPPPEIIE
ncbi:MAG: AsmA-like C-terminal region-containing protein, partial [Pseudomonadota bacterium]